MNISQDTRWEKCLRLFQDNVSPEHFRAWFEPLEFQGFVNNRIVLHVPSLFFAEQIEAKFYSLMSKTFERVFGSDFRVTFNYNVVNKDPGSEISIESVSKSPIIENRIEQAQQQPSNPFNKVDYGDIDPQLNPKYTFENYCDSASNKLAVSIGKAIATDPKCKTFNPLFVFGPTGVGKTHLIEAIGIKYKVENPHSRVLYITARVFESQYTTAVRNNKVNEFINFYQSIDVLIIDDIQDLAGKTATQNTFFHIFNHLHQNGKQLILTSDRAPIMLQGMEDRLLTRFKWGLVAELEKPDIELRKNILRDKIHRDGLIIPDSVICYIAENVNESVRELEGIINSLLVYSIQLKREINLELVQRIVRKAVNCTETKPLTIDSIINKVCNYYHIDTSTIHTKTRKREVVQVRQVAMYLAKKYTDISSSKIGQLIGNKDHATVLHACKIIKDQVEINKTFKNEIEEIESSLHT